MSRRGVWPLLMVLGLLAVSCGSGEGEGTSPTPAATTPVPTPTTEATTTTESASDDQEIEEYLVVMSNLAAEIGDQVGEFECSYNEQFSPGFCGHGNFVEEGEEFEPPPERTEEEQFEYLRGYWLGTFDLHLAHADVLESVVAPTGFESAHQEYVAAYRAYFTLLRDGVAGLTTLSEFESFFAPLFDPFAAVPADLERALFGAVDACGSLEQTAAETGFRAELDCPTPPPKPVSVEVEVGSVWVAAPNPLPVGDGLVRMTITNTGVAPIRPVVLDIFEGDDPLNLPVVDGVVDLSSEGQFFSSSRFAAFGLAYPDREVLFGAGENSTVVGEPPELLPGESIEAVIWSEGTIVVFDYEPGEFEAGAYVVVERSGPG